MEVDLRSLILSSSSDFSSFRCLLTTLSTGVALRLFPVFPVASAALPLPPVALSLPPVTLALAPVEEAWGLAGLDSSCFFRAAWTDGRELYHSRDLTALNMLVSERYSSPSPRGIACLGLLGT